MINIYDNLDRNLYLITSLQSEGNEVSMSAKEIQSYNEVFSESLTSGELYGNFSLKDGILQSSNFVSSSTGWQLTPTSGQINFTLSVDSLDIGGSDTTSWHVDTNGNMWWGNAGSYAAATIKISSVGSIDFTTGNFSGTLSAPDGTLGTITAGSISVVNGANTIGFTPTGTNAIFSGTTGSPEFKVTPAGAVTTSNITITGGTLNINDNAVINSNGFGTFIGLTSLNKKAYTNFENSGRFVNTTTTGTSIAPVYGNQGVTISTTTTSDRYSRILWDIANVFTNNPTFTATVILNVASGTLGTAFVGIGDIGVAGTGHTTSNRKMIAFRFAGGGGSNMNIIGFVNDGSASALTTSTLATVTTGDKVELMISVLDGTVTFYVRKNGGALSSGSAISSQVPGGASDNDVHFSVSNENSSNNISLIIQGVAYEH